MRSSKSSFRFAGEVALISIHPHHVANILAGSKNLEFRRVWPDRAIETLVIYATSPIQRVAAVVEVTGVLRASKTALWAVAGQEGGGVTRAQLSQYLDGKRLGVALRIGHRQSFGDGVPLGQLFGSGARPPQSFRYLTAKEKTSVQRLIEGTK